MLQELGMRRIASGLLVIACVALVGCPNSGDDTDSTGCVEEDCVRQCHEAGHASGACADSGLCQCWGTSDGGDVDVPDADDTSDRDVEPDVADDAVSSEDSADPGDEGWHEDFVAYDDGRDSSDFPSDVYDYGYDTSDYTYDVPDYVYDVPDYGYDASDYVYDVPDYGYDVYDAYDAGASCRAWSDWSCSGTGGSCSGTCGIFVLSCDGSTCSCLGPGIGVACPSPGGTGCDQCANAVATGCCPF
jgi:hypothetical protein